MDNTRLRDRKILVVDDEERMVRFIRLNLEHDGFQVFEAYNGTQAINRIRTNLPDLILLVVMLPDIDGFEVLRIIREVSSVPVIMLTAKAQDADVFKGWQSGVDCYLTKPFNPMELISFVKRIFKSLEGGGSDGEKRYEIT